jgi:hypothetical protein
MSGEGNNVRTQFEAFLARHQDPEAAAWELYNDNQRVRRSRTTIQTDYDALLDKFEALERKTKGYTPDRVLTEEQFKLWQAYQALGDPAELAKLNEGLQSATSELNTLRRTAMLDTVADVAKVKRSALEKLSKLDSSIEGYDVREEELDGAKIKRAYIKVGGKEQELHAYLNAEWADFVPVLTVKDEDTEEPEAGKDEAKKTFPRQKPVPRAENAGKQKRDPLAGVLSQYAPPKVQE